MRIAAAAFLTLACLPAASRPAVGKGSQSPQVGEDTERFRVLAKAAGLPSARNHPFVEFVTGSYTMAHGDQPAKVHKSKGLLLGDDGESFRVLNERFVELTYQKTPASTPEVRKVGYVPIDLVPVATAHLKLERAWDGTFDLFYGWLCDGSGQTRLAGQLYERVVNTRKHGAAGIGFETAAQIDLGFARYEDAIAKFEQRLGGDAAVLASFDRWLTAFPDHELAGETAELRAALHLAMTTTLPTDATLSQRLVHDLTSLKGGLSVNGGWPYVMPVEGGERSADQLFMLGTKAVPALLAALRDVRPTRCVRTIGRRSARSQVMRVNRTAHQILNAIAGLSMDHTDPASLIPAYDAWWQRVQTVGLTQELRTRTESGDRSAANRLLQIAPELVADAIATALLTVKQDWQRRELLKIASRTEGAAATKLLREILASGDALAIAAVAEPLLKQPEHRYVALGALKRAWRRSEPGSKDAEAIAPLLCRYGDMAAIEALQSRVQCLTGRELRHLAGDSDEPKPHATVTRAQEQLLLHLIHDERHLSGVFGGTLDPRRCDYAAQELAKRWPQRFAFDAKLLRADRDAALARLRGLQPDAVPAAAAEDVLGLRRTLAAWDRENLESQRSRILKDITNPALLPTLRQRREEVFKVRRDELDVACRRLASTVTAIGPDAELDKLPTALSDRLRALKGHALAPRELADCIGELVNTPAPGVRTHTFEVLRRSNGLGLFVQIHSTSGDGEIRPRPQYQGGVAVGSQIVMHTTGAGIRSALRKGGIATFAARLTDALAAPDSRAVEARLRLTQRL